jgi:hypothetical protein
LALLISETERKRILREQNLKNIQPMADSVSALALDPALAFESAAEIEIKSKIKKE